MVFKYTKNTNSSIVTSATSAIPGRESEMSKNDGGGVTFNVSDFDVLDRFLNLGATDGTFYLGREKHQYNNTQAVIKCIKSDGVRVVDRIAEVSDKGTAFKNDHAIYALALCFSEGDNACKQRAVEQFNKVVRIGTHLFMFVEFVKSMRGFGKLVRQAINNWYTEKDTKSLAFQLSKYKQREGWSHRDVFRLSHPSFGKTTNKNKIAKWAMDKEDSSKWATAKDEGLNFLCAVDTAKTASVKEVLSLINKYGLQREHLSTEMLNNPQVQETMLPHLGGTAMLRNLGNMSKSGLMTPLSKTSKFVCDRLTDKEFLKKNRLHPLSILTAQRIYGQGHGMLGGGSWNVDNNVVSALEDAFYLSFDTVEPTNANMFYGLDVSGSMGSQMSGTPLKYCEVAAVLAMVSLRKEKYTFVGGFQTYFTPLNITKNMDLKKVCDEVVKRNFGSTNPASAIQYAIKEKMDVDAFVFITDNDMNSGGQPCQVLRDYRRKMNKPRAKMIVTALLSTYATIADPKDPLTLDIHGFSPEFPTFLSNFIRN